RQLTLDSEAFYSQTDFARDTSGQAKLDNQKQQIHDKQQEIDSLKSQLAALEQERRRIKPEATEAATPPENNPTAPSTSAPPPPAPPTRPNEEGRTLLPTGRKPTTPYCGFSLHTTACHGHNPASIRLP